MHYKKLSIALAATAIAATTILTGCTSSGSSSGSGSGSGSAKTLNLALSGAPASLDFTQFGTGTNPLIMSMLYDRIAYQAPDGKVEPQAATKWVYSKNNTVLTVTLHSGMKFSNGDPVDSAAVKATILRQKAAKTNTNPQMFTPIASIGTPNATTAVFNLKAADPNLIANLSNSVGLIGDPKTFNAKTIATNPIGSGPYTLDTSATVPDTKYVLKKNTNYWNAKNYPYGTVNVSIITDPTATFNALRSGQLDVAPISLDQSSTAKGAGYTVSEAPYAEVGAMVIGDRDGKTIPALGNVQVRQAINMVFDRASMVKALNKGYGQPTDELFQPNSTGYVKSLTNTYPYDVAKAKQLMASAGFASGFSVTMPSVAGTTTAYEPTVTQALAQINIKVSWVTTPFSQIVGKITSGTLPLYYWPLGWNDMPTNLNVLVAADGFFNGYKSTNSDIAALLATADAAKTPAAQTAAFQAVGKYMIDQAWYAPLFTYPNLYASAKSTVYSPNQIILTDNIRYYSPK